jgi:hypothetical protein
LIIIVLFFLIPYAFDITIQNITLVSDSVHEEFSFLDTMKNIGISSKEIFFYFLNFSFSIIILELKNLFLVTIPGIIYILFELLLWTIGIFILPIIGIWCAELNAEIFMAEVSDSPPAPAGALDRLSQKMPMNFGSISQISTLSRWFRKWILRDTNKIEINNLGNILKKISFRQWPLSISQWLLFHISHPPKLFRKWMIIDTKKTESIIVFLLLYPFAYILKLALLLIRALIAWITGGISGFSYLTQLAINTHTYFQGASLSWLRISIFILLWPTIAIYWVKFFSGAVEFSNWKNYKQYFVSAGIILCFFLL